MPLFYYRDWRLWILYNAEFIEDPPTESLYAFKGIFDLSFIMVNRFEFLWVSWDDNGKRIGLAVLFGTLEFYFWIGILKSKGCFNIGWEAF